VFGEIVASYGAVGEPEAASGRAYHNLNHIWQVLQSAAEIKELARDWTAVQLAIWFHDVVYEPGAADNEEQSANFAREKLQALGISEQTIRAVEQLILATKLNGTAVTHPDAPLIQDADLATLGWPPADYDRYAQAIRQEFAHVPEREYRIGRAQLLTHFLQQPRIYRTDRFFAKLEAQARQNLEREREEMRNEK
jgi:predicted metal-dependent HD superfamily phosphohydrolase